MGIWRCTAQGTRHPLDGRPLCRGPAGSTAPTFSLDDGHPCRPVPARATDYQPVTLKSVEKV